MFVSAGDLEKYAYCPLSWWLSKQQKLTSKEGVKWHKKIEEDITDIKRKEITLKFYEKFILFFALSATIVSFIGLLLLYSELKILWRYFFVIISLLWLLNSSFFLYKASRAPEIIKPRYEKVILISSMGALIIALFTFFLSFPKEYSLSTFFEILAILWITIANLLFYRSINLSEKLIVKKIRYAPPKSKIVYIGADKGEEIVSEIYGIRGKPDYIIEVDDEYIPVEEKSSNLSSPPLHHVIQLTAYCMLTEEKYGKKPSYGILRYREKEFKIPYEERWRNMVIELREKIIRDLERKEVHRNHNNKKKCDNCLRKEICPERLS
ncbi:CRISPR-associated protein Cas4 [Thermoplasmatales archaeon ex4484_30]|nr:MAG: CRISPR-associated protein Cas4 [Thermoplasmata archaeon]OYT62088.1 MAG: CRISPR-associated protein Cas4 [Thermoplasmatales archaeon ex4484_30]